MCGIFGIQTSKKNLNIKNICFKADRALLHRGPDDGKVWFNKSTGLVHRRLSIIDLKNGSQPMISANNRYIIIFNGEIVNYKSLQNQFLSHRNLKTNSDTEVLLELYDELGTKMLEHIKGMFAFSIFDKFTEKFFLARDHLGIKPLYYYKDKNLFVFSSEVKAFYKAGIKKFEIEKNKLNEFLVHGSIYGQKTLHKNIYELKPGNYLFGSKDFIKVNKYWDAIKSKKNQKNRLNNISKQIEENLIKTIEEWCSSDVKVGSLLSGGLDSTFVSTIASKFRKIEMFTNYFPDRKKEDNETILAGLIAKRTKSKHHKVKVKDNFSINNIEKLVRHLCDPIQDLNSLSFMALCKYIKLNTNIKVVLTGEGSDELFGGYDRHQGISETYKKSKNFNDILYAMNYLSSDRLKYFFNTKYTLSAHRKKIVNEFKNTNYSVLNKVLIHDQKTFLPGYLDRVDKISMMYGLEVRTPFLDERIISIANKCGSDFKIKKINNDFVKKYILRKIFEKYLPKKIVWNSTKYQFSYPTAASFKDGALNEIFKDLINSNSKITNYFELKNLNWLLKHHENGFADHSNLLGRILTFELFARLSF